MDRVSDRDGRPLSETATGTDLAPREVPTVIVEPRPVEAPVDPTRRAELIDGALVLLSGVVHLALRWVELRGRQAGVQAMMEPRSSSVTGATDRSGGGRRRRQRRREGRLRHHA